ncbi:unnamed protein product [marine sediment metagenome]|uniref:Glycosyl hydrolase family 13 catalytic domain-containing protein n=1 Tax=marine sediment metagenome TaxID=412755 RepID=X1SB78_9ZZZZ
MSTKTEKAALDENGIIYQILTDRFCDGDPSNNDFGQGEYKLGDFRFYQGGDWQGIIDKMDYIKNLGVTAIQISPIHHNQWMSQDKTHAGYHGYFIYDFYSPEPHFGTLEKLKELVEAAHGSGIAVILDGKKCREKEPPFREGGQSDRTLGVQVRVEREDTGEQGRERVAGGMRVLSDCGATLPEVPTHQLLVSATMWRNPLPTSGWGWGSRG